MASQDLPNKRKKSAPARNSRQFGRLGRCGDDNHHAGLTKSPPRAAVSVLRVPNPTNRCPGSKEFSMKRFLTRLFTNGAKPPTIHPPLTERNKAFLRVEALEDR